MGLSLISTPFKTYLIWSVKLIFGLVIFAFVAWRVKGILETENWLDFTWNNNQVILLLIAFILMFANWSFEALKWKILLQNLNAMTFKASFKGVLAGLATGLITPNRMGNFIGRIAHLDKEIRLRATIRTFYANLMQFSVTLIFGVIGLVAWRAEINGIAFITLITLTLAGILSSLLILLKPKLLLVRPFIWLLSTNIKTGILELNELNLALKFNLLLLSSVRYFIFVIQYVLVLLSLNYSGGIGLVVMAVVVMYLIMTLVPSLFLGKLFVREAAGLIVFSTIGIQDNVIILAAFIVWLINIAIPALFGVGLLLKK